MHYLLFHPWTGSPSRIIQSVDGSIRIWGRLRLACPDQDPLSADDLCKDHVVVFISHNNRSLQIDAVLIPRPDEHARLRLPAGAGIIRMMRTVIKILKAVLVPKCLIDFLCELFRTRPRAMPD